MTDDTSNRSPARLAADRAHAERMKGNKYASRARVIRDALRKALYRRDPNTGERYLDVIAANMVQDAAYGHVDPSITNVARREVFDRVAGKAVQATEVSGPDGGAIAVVITPDDLSAV